MIIIILLTLDWVLALAHPLDFSIPLDRTAIFFEVSGGLSGSEEIYIHGNRLFKYRKLSGLVPTVRVPREIQVHELTVVTPDTIYHVNLIDQTGSATTNPARLIRQEFDQLPDRLKEKFLNELKKLKIALPQLLSGTFSKTPYKIGLENIFNQPCLKYDILGSTFWIWKELPYFSLKTKSFYRGVSIQSTVHKILRNHVDFEDEFAQEITMPRYIHYLPDPQREEELLQATFLAVDAIKSGESIDMIDFELVKKIKIQELDSQDEEDLSNALYLMLSPD